MQCPTSCRTQRLGVLTHPHHFRRCRVTFNLLSNQKFVQGPSSRGPAINVSYHMGIRTALYNYFTTQVSSAPPPSYTAKGASASTCPIPRLIDCAPAGIRHLRQARQYFVDAARELLLGTPLNDSALVHDLVLCFVGYSTGAQFKAAC